jgi:hypothetical protein
VRQQDTYSVEKVVKSLGEVGCPNEKIVPQVGQVALSKYSCLRERICWWIVFEISLCVFIENIIFC